MKNLFCVLLIILFASVGSAIACEGWDCSDQSYVNGMGMGKFDVDASSIGDGLSSGVYFVRIEADLDSDFIKMVYLQ